MKNIADFLGKFKSIGSEGYRARLAAAEVLQELFSITVPIEDITWKGAKLVVKGTPVLKSQLFIKKFEILRKIRERTSNITIEDIQ